MESRLLPPVLRSWIIGLLLASMTNFAAAQIPSRLQKHYHDYQKQTEKLVQKLEQLQVEADKISAADLSQRITRHLAALKGETKISHQLPTQVRPEIRFNLPPGQREMEVNYRRACEEAARNYYLLARRAQTDSPTFAFELLNLLLTIDPDHPSARAMRGYVRQGNRWMTHFEREQLKAGRVEHPVFGWLPASHVEKYEQGARYFLGNWVTVEKEAEIRRDFRYAWEVQTEHFQIKTNVSLEKGVELGKKLELFHDYFKQTFALFYNSPEQLKMLFDENNGRAKTRSQLYEVHFYREKEEYVAKLQKRIPQIAMTNGLYQLEDRTSYFYHDENTNNDATIFHEATHQLMYESHLRQRDVGQHAHFWIIEGIACYMESFRVEADDSEQLTFEVGNPQFLRFYWARRRLLEENYSPSLEVFSKLGMVPFQTGSEEELQRRYSLASGLSHFFMHYEEGKYRSALMQHLAQLYHSNPRTQYATPGLDKLTGVSYSTLDRQYREYIQDQQIAVGSLPVIQ